MIAAWPGVFCPCVCHGDVEYGECSSGGVIESVSNDDMMPQWPMCLVAMPGYMAWESGGMVLLRS
jgi:hypothetical protein